MLFRRPCKESVREFTFPLRRFSVALQKISQTGPDLRRKDFVREFTFFCRKRFPAVCAAGNRPVHRQSSRIAGAQLEVVPAEDDEDGDGVDPDLGLFARGSRISRAS